MISVGATQLQSGKKKQHKHKLFGPDFPRTFPTLTPGCPGVKKFLPTTGAAGKRTFWCGRPLFSARTSMTRRVVEKLCTKTVCVDFLAPIQANCLISCMEGLYYQHEQGMFVLFQVCVGCMKLVSSWRKLQWRNPETNKIQNADFPQKTFELTKTTNADSFNSPPQFFIFKPSVFPYSPKLFHWLGCIDIHVGHGWRVCYFVFLMSHTILAHWTAPKSLPMYAWSDRGM